MRVPVPLATCSVLLAVLATAGCGSGRKLQSVALSPASADAKSFPNGEVPFAATGTFSRPPSPVTLTSKDVSWCVGGDTGACPGNIDPGAMVDTNGVAQCRPGFTGTVTVLAGSGSSSSPMNPDGGYSLKVFGAAQLTCP
jgi:hypothetical protein